MNGLSYSPAIFTSEPKYKIKKINSTHCRIFLFILQNLDIIHVPHLDFIWPNFLDSQVSISSFRKMRGKKYTIRKVIK